MRLELHNGVDWEYKGRSEAYFVFQFSELFWVTKCKKRIYQTIFGSANLVTGLGTGIFGFGSFSFCPDSFGSAHRFMVNMLTPRNNPCTMSSLDRGKKGDDLVPKQTGA